MRTLLSGICIAIASTVCAQRACLSADYISRETISDPSLSARINGIEEFIRHQDFSAKQNGEGMTSIIRIPVVVHVLYNTAGQNLSDSQIKSQIAALNRDFRRTNADTVNTPLRFRPFAADVQIEFVLATADPFGRFTNGIVRKATSVSEWNMDDRIKFSSQGGDDAWDSHNYLNIWVGHMSFVLGYATVPGCTAEKDGIVINTSVFGTFNTAAPYEMGRTAVHEIGHWLGLKHIWGDTYCGDDAVDDTPKQGNFTAGCPSVFRSSCSNGSLGDMYMNYMDYTNDACMNIFTAGQRQRMRALFADGGPRQQILMSKGLSAPWVREAPVMSSLIDDNSIRFYPNPVKNEMVLDMNPSWIGKNVYITNMNGVIVLQIKLTSDNEKVNLEKLPAGMYFLQGGEGQQRIRQKLIKL